MLSRIIGCACRIGRGTTVSMTRSRRLIRLKARATAHKDILNATFTLLPEYRNGRAAVVAANGIVYGCFGPEREPAEKSDTLLFFIGAALGEMF